MQLNKQNILEKTDNGLDFYRFVIRDLVQQGAKCKNVKNPFYADTHASLSIFRKHGQWLYKDFGNSSFSGDIFTFAAQYYNLSLKNDFFQILKNINSDLHLNLSETQEMKDLTKVEQRLFHIRKTPKIQAIEYQKSRGLTKPQYFFQSNAYKTFPYAVIFVNHNETGFEYRFIASKEELQRVNLPKTQFFGEKANSLFVAAFDNKKDTVFICEGPNNALSFAEIGFSAIATFGATNIPTPELLRKFIENKIIFLAGDGDEAGRKFNSEIALLISVNKIPIKSILVVQFPDNKDANDLLIENNLLELDNLIGNIEFENNSKEKPNPKNPINPNSQIQQNEKWGDKKEKIFDTPFLPESIYQNLPQLLAECTELFQDSVEKDVVLIGSLGVLSACLPNIEGTYFETEYSAHLYIFITAPAGGGKGNLKWAKYFGQVIHDKMVEQSQRDKVEYEAALEQYNSMKKSERVDGKPEKPPFKMFYIPGNSSSAAFTDVLSDNGFHGIMFETEADTVAQTFKNDWGSYSDILRKAFQHETTSLKRKETYIEIKEPHLAVVLSGTPKQVHNLMPTNEDGLFSRFLYYAFEDESDFKNPFIKHTKVNFKSFFTEKGNEVFQLYNTLKDLIEPIEFQITETQANHFTEIFNSMINRNRFLVGRDFDANVKRLGLITFRIAMILTALRILETGDVSSPLICNDTDYNTAMELALTLEKHAIAVFQNLPNNNLKGNKLKFFESLPDEFDRQTYLNIANDLEIKDKTAENYIAQFCQKGLLSHIHNRYSKIEK